MSRSPDRRLAACLVAALAAVAICATTVAAQAPKQGPAQAAAAGDMPAFPKRKYGLGRPATAEEIAGWDIDARPDGHGLPEGSGSVKDGEEVYIGMCAACHGEFGEGNGRWPQLTGGAGTLAQDDPLKTVGSFYPHAATAFSYVRHAMPFGNAQSLTVDETYAVVAYVLFLNDIVPEDFVLDRTTIATVKMPNANGFVPDDREVSERRFWTRAPCMKNCKAAAKIVGRASEVGVTPDDPAATRRRGGVD